jgi:Glycopeptide antibiotics resistance protein
MLLKLHPFRNKILLAYLLLLIIFVILKFDGNLSSQIDTIRRIRFNRYNYNIWNINLIPFQTMLSYRIDVSFWNILGNVVPFIPLGFLISMKFPKQVTAFKIFITCLVIILCFEFLQFITCLGYADVDDVILNTFSCMLGWLGYKAIQSSMANNN